MKKITILAVTLVISSSAFSQTIVKDRDVKAAQCYAFLFAASDYRQMRAQGNAINVPVYLKERDKALAMVQSDPDLAQRLGIAACRELKVI